MNLSKQVGELLADKHTAESAMSNKMQAFEKVITTTQEELKETKELAKTVKTVGMDDIRANSEAKTDVI